MMVTQIARRMCRRRRRISVPIAFGCIVVLHCGAQRNALVAVRIALLCLDCASLHSVAMCRIVLRCMAWWCFSRTLPCCVMSVLHGIILFQVSVAELPHFPVGKHTLSGSALCPGPQHKGKYSVWYVVTDINTFTRKPLGSAKFSIDDDIRLTSFVVEPVQVRENRVFLLVLGSCTLRHRVRLLLDGYGAVGGSLFGG